MIEIYNEREQVIAILENGLTEKWKKDIALLAKHYKEQGVKKSIALQTIKDMCLEGDKNGVFSYNPFTQYNTVNRIFNSTWTKGAPLREITKVEISREVIDWFLGLEKEYVLTDEEVEQLKLRRPKVTIKKNVINWQRTKYLFTLYVWTRIQENYLDKPNMHYLKQYYKRFKEDADLKAAFNMQRERDLMFDLGFINVNYALGINASFIEKFEVFKTPITDENRVELTGEDMYKCGYWLEKQKMGSFICKHCGKEFAHYSKGNREMGRKYCKECALILKNDLSELDGCKTIVCIDCGTEVKVPIKDTKTCRCEECQERENKEKIRLRVQKFRNKTNM